MMSSYRTCVTLLGIATLCTLGAACSSSGDTPSGGTGGKSSGSSGTSSGSGGTSSGSSGTSSGGAGKSGSGATGDKCENTGDVNEDCPMIQPFSGACAPKGKCCHRAANSVKDKALAADAMGVLEYRMNAVLTANHPKTIGVDPVLALSLARGNNEEQSTIMRVEYPRKDGKPIAGMGKFTNYVGRYNCDGTYSYYDDAAAPKKDKGGLTDDVTRWAPPVVMAKFDPTKIGTKDWFSVPFSERSNRKLQYVPFVKPADFSYDWELVNQGYRLLDFKAEGDGLDCIGERESSTTWKAGGHFELYTPMPQNNTQIISTIQESYCTLVAFGIVTDKTLDCEKTERCMPGAAGCKWVKLPDALCPTSDSEIDTYGCHLGAKGNVNMEAGYPADADLKCTDTAPAEPQDQDKVMTVGQCCDPLGKMTGGLPACNAYRLINDVVAGAAEITDKRENGLQPMCKN